MDSQRTPWLLTGVTGGLGAKILNDMLQVHNVPPQNIIATARSESRRETHESRGLQFRILDYDRPETLHPALENVENLLFMSSAERHSPTRIAQHSNVIEAAKAQGVKKVWYVSLAFGGYGDDSKIGFQAAHYETEKRLVKSELDFVSLRAGVYADAFPLFLNWYPSSTKIILPTLDPPMGKDLTAFATRDELGEAMATIFAKGPDAFPGVKPKTEKNIILLTGPKAESLLDIVGAISRGLEKEIPVEYLSPDEWIEESAKDDVGGKQRPWFEARLVFLQGLIKGDAATVNPALETNLGRRPRTGSEAVEEIVRKDPGYTWHQNHVNRGS
jgi:uncharacterized protein YbjT (DUF2867 family)